MDEEQYVNYIKPRKNVWLILCDFVKLLDILNISLLHKLLYSILQSCPMQICIDHNLRLGQTNSGQLRDCLWEKEHFMHACMQKEDFICLQSIKFREKRNLTFGGVSLTIDHS